MKGQEEGRREWKVWRRSHVEENVACTGRVMSCCKVKQLSQCGDARLEALVSRLPSTVSSQSLHPQLSAGVITHPQPAPPVSPPTPTPRLPAAWPLAPRCPALMVTSCQSICILSYLWSIPSRDNDSSVDVYVTNWLIRLDKAWGVW